MGIGIADAPPEVACGRVAVPVENGLSLADNRSQIEARVLDEIRRMERHEGQAHQ